MNHHDLILYSRIFRKNLVNYVSLRAYLLFDSWLCPPYFFDFRCFGMAFLMINLIYSLWCRSIDIFRQSVYMCKYSMFFVLTHIYFYIIWAYQIKSIAFPFYLFIAVDLLIL